MMYAAFSSAAVSPEDIVVQGAIETDCNCLLFHWASPYALTDATALCQRRTSRFRSLSLRLG